VNLGLSGRLTKATTASPLTPLFLLALLVVGLIAVTLIPREEEPQISVPMVDIRVNADGLRAPDAVELVTRPLEAIVKAIDGVEHVYSQTEDDRVMVTARFLVGTKSDDAILRVHEKISANLDRTPVGIPEPLIVGRGINDVAVAVLTLSPKPDAAEHWSDKDLYEVADKLRAELMKVDNIGLTYIAGGAAQQIRVEPDPEKLSLYGVTLQQLVGRVKDANRSFLAGGVRDAGIVRNVAAGQTLTGIPDIGLLLIATRDGRPVYMRDIASIVIGPNTSEHRVCSDMRDGSGNWQRAPAVSLALAKRAGANAVVVSNEIAHRLEGLKPRLIPDGVQVTVTRDYGETANEKANELLFHLALATISIVVLIALAELGQVVQAAVEDGSPAIFRRDGRFADTVMAELAGRFEAPLYGMIEVANRLDAHDWGALPKPVISLHGQPADESHPTLLWDGEREITYVSFRDMGAAFGAAILGIYVLVVAQFRSFRLPLVVLTPVPLTLIGILIGHWLLGAPFTVTSMIGFIALAGIIVRNSILLVDFIRYSGGEGKSLRDVVLQAGAVRFKPILLTALAAMIGAATILLDPIFQGLAISLLFGLAPSTLLTVLVIPAIYVALRQPSPRISSSK
jgi:multidrug efflux pump subunit AcrB